MNPTALLAEAIAWESGCWPRSAPTPTHALAASGLAERLRRWARKFARSTSPLPFDYVEPLPQAKLEKLILTEITPEQGAAWIEHMPPDVGIEYLQVIKSARTECDRLWPRYEVPGLVAEVADLSNDDHSKVFTVFQVLDSPDRITDELLQWSVAPEQVEAFRVVFPEISALIDDALANELIELSMKKQSIAWQIEDLIGVWREAPPNSPVTTSKAPPPAPAAPGSPEIKNAATEQQAAQQRRENRK